MRFAQNYGRMEICIEVRYFILEMLQHNKIALGTSFLTSISHLIVLMALCLVDGSTDNELEYLWLLMQILFFVCMQIHAFCV